jgi:type IV pilus assembly protein PilO
VENLDNLSPVQKNILLILPTLLIVILGMMFLLIPLYDQRSKLVTDIDTQNADMQKVKAQAQKLEMLKAENEVKKKELMQLEAQLPAEKEVSELLKQVSDLGIKAGLEVILWKPGEKSVHSSKDVYEIPVNVEMRGSYHSLGYFFSRVTELPRIVTFNNITLKQGGKGASRNPVTLSVIFRAHTYSSISEEEKKAIEKAEKADKGKKGKK